MSRLLAMPIFTLGMACRPAYQLKKNLENEFISGPFDWTVTSAKSVFNFFAPDFNIEHCLSASSIRFFDNGIRLRCNYSDLIFEHGLGPNELKNICIHDGKEFLRYSPTPSSFLLEQEDYAKTRGRFLYNAKRLMEMCEICESPIVFVRWIGCGLDNPHRKIPHAGHADYDDNAISMALAIKTRFPSINMHFVQVQTIYAEKHEGNRRIAFVDKVQDDVSLIYLKENMPKRFVGDDDSWSQLSQYLAKNII